MAKAFHTDAHWDLITLVTEISHTTCLPIKKRLAKSVSTGRSILMSAPSLTPSAEGHAVVVQLHIKVKGNDG